MTEKAYAKINLYLDCIGRRNDGYHELCTVMHTVSLCDTVSLEKADNISVSCSDSSVPSDERNIAYKCAQTYFKVCGIQGGARIHIDKHIPSQAGLGGGSADGAAVLRMLNRAYGGTDIDGLLSAAASCGADIPFLIKGGAALCEGIGERIAPLAPMHGCVLIAKGEHGISTPEAYRRIDELAPGKHLEPREVMTLYSKGKLPLYNIFEQAVDIPDVMRIKDIISGYGAQTLMSGSGSAVYGLFADDKTACECAGTLSGKGFFSGVYYFTDEVTA